MTNFLDQFMGIGILVVLLVVALVIFIGRYKTASPDKALIVSGSFLGSKNTHIDKATGNTMKVVRGKVEEHFRSRLDYLYSPEGRNLKNAENLAALKKIVG